ncbi:hypothetical protein [Nonomuraea wenchangensis]|uniref:Uncharacterized protein n=1 Tax=Nonomuraea wenchangensis TaxID=568860 RepID=A0A1I0F1P3_9ACTN|nr:hypothetical protein [Nonomuraea wenchangensis]SET51696.1 hypothetical protein SAMN05421811_103284 [Nonomuraea wenchangensis]
MSDITPEKVAATPPTPENVAEMLTMGDNDYHDGNYWHPSIGAAGNVVHIGITPYADDDEGTKLPEVHFRAVVVEGEQTPIVLERPATLEVEWGPADEVRSWVSPDLFVVVNTMKATNVGFLTPVEARRLAARLAALADEAQKLADEEIARRRAEAAQAEQGGGA